MGVDKTCNNICYNIQMIKKLSLLLSLLSPSILFANSQYTDGYSNAISILMFYSVVSAVALGIVTSIIVIINGRRMKGGIFGGALKYLGIGMLIVLAGTVASIFPSLTPQYLDGVLPSILSTVGYVTMAIAATKILKVTRV
jgi:hypothetical protein